MPGRAQHPTDDMREHARHELQMIEMRQQIERLGDEINDRQQHRAALKKSLFTLQQLARAKE